MAAFAKSEMNVAARCPDTVLIVDDEAGILNSVTKILTKEGYRAFKTDSGREALDLLRTESIDVVLSDIMMPKMSGIELLKAAKMISPKVEVVMMTAYGTIENAVECMREGAYDFIAKPLKRAMVVGSVKRALERSALIRENLQLRESLEAVSTDFVVGQSQPIQSLLKTLRQAARSKATVLLNGESGTGKELLAREIHRCSEREHQPFVAVNCGAIPETLLESELFGHEKGAFTGATDRSLGRFERAHRGTIFLDEIGEMPMPMQVRLLRVLQEGEVERLGGKSPVSIDVRVVAATHQNLKEMVQDGRFREDLFYRLNVIALDIPPLRHRPGDVVLLAHHFLKIFNKKNETKILGFTDHALRKLETYRWPGNVRELENAIERAVVLSQGDILDGDGFPDWSTGDEIPDNVLRSAQNEEGFFVPFGTPLEQVEERLISETLRRTGGDKKTTANILGIAVRTLYRKLATSESE